uniref:HAT C-terminal dimerisation domain-containing protein n=1 Tax=Amphimedon queenslandica TaxID=400682 RepID=A0A1X7VJB0_AMPQE
MIVQDSSDDANIGNEFNTPQTQDLQESEEKPPPKRFKHLSLVCKLLDEEESITEVVTPSLSKEEEEIKKYIGSALRDEEKELDPLDFWIRVKETYPLLYPVACDIMSTPASTAPG